MLDVSNMMAVQKDSELTGSFLSNLKFAITSVFYWRSQDGPWFQKTYDSQISCDARSYASDAAALNNSKPGAPAPPPPSQAASVRQANCSDAVNDRLSAASWNTSEPKIVKRRHITTQDIADADEVDEAFAAALKALGVTAKQLLAQEDLADTPKYPVVASANGMNKDPKAERQVAFTGARARVQYSVSALPCKYVALSSLQFRPAERQRNERELVRQSVATVNGRGN